MTMMLMMLRMKDDYVDVEDNDDDDEDYDDRLSTVLVESSEDPIQFCICTVKIYRSPHLDIIILSMPMMMMIRITPMMMMIKITPMMMMMKMTMPMIMREGGWKRKDLQSHLKSIV